MMEVTEAKSRLIEWSVQADSAKSAFAFGLGPSLGVAAAGLIVGRLLPRPRQRGATKGGSLVEGVLSAATLFRIAKWVLPIVLKKI